MAGRLGYLVPEFPGQTHIWIWRDMRFLEQFGVELFVISTRRPPPLLVTHTWSPHAIGRTHYLYPIPVRALFAAIWEVLRAGPRAWYRCLKAIAVAQGLAPRKRLRLVGLCLIGGRVVRMARKNAFSHVHIHSCADSAHIVMFAHLIYPSLTYSLTLHGPTWAYGPNQKQKWMHARFCIVNTRLQLKDVEENVNECMPPRVEIGVIGIDQSTFKRNRPYAPWRGEGPARVFCCARLNTGKAHDDLIRAIWMLRERGVPAELRIAGEDDSKTGFVRKMLGDLMDELGMRPYVTLLGAQPEEVVMEELQNAHVFSMASWREPLGMSTMEAMSMEVPVVVMSGGGVPEFITDGADGLLVEPKNIDQLADTLGRLLHDPELAIRLSTAGRKRIAACFEPTRTARIILGSTGLIDDREFKPI
jgi:glycosyltransferase involved in cell wall biosynthesis